MDINVIIYNVCVCFVFYFVFCFMIRWREEEWSLWSNINVNIGLFCNDGYVIYVYVKGSYIDCNG